MHSQPIRRAARQWPRAHVFLLVALLLALSAALPVIITRASRPLAPPITPTGPGTADGRQGTATGVGSHNLNGSLVSGADVSGTKTVSGTFVAGGSITYTVVLSNSGLSAQLDNTGDEFTDVLPAGLTLVSAMATSGTAVTSVNTVTWNGSIPASGSVTITITANINSDAGGTTVSNQGSIAYDADANDTNEANRVTDDPSTGAADDPTSFAVPCVTTVTNLNDSGAGSLRQAIINANSSPCTETVDFQPGLIGTITLSSALPDLSTSMSILGPGSSQLTISGNSTVRVFNVTVASPGLVTFSELTIANGRASANAGGGIFNQNTGTINVTNSTLSGNVADTAGGGIYNQSTGTINVTNSTLSSNPAPNGGGIYNFSTGTINVTNSTLSNNPAGNGGGIYNFSTGTIAIVNSTLSGNSAAGGAGGGGIYNNSTGPVQLRNSIVALNTATSSGPDLSGAMISQGHNLIGKNDGSTGFTIGSNNDQVGTGASPLDPRLGGLANNGGQTQTMALLAGSPALDAGDDCVTQLSGCLEPNITADQRGEGFDRSVDGPDLDLTGAVDIGAFEAQVSLEDILNRTTNEDTQLQFTFNVSGTASSVIATSGNTALVPNDPANIALSGSGSTRTLTINPVANQFGTSTITVTVSDVNTQSMSDTFVLNVNAIADTPSVTNATTNEDTQSTSGLVISRNAVDGAEVTHFKITAITNGTLVKNDGTPINNGDFITFAEGNAGLKFTPAANLFSPGTTFSFQVQGATSPGGAGLSSGFATATITVNTVADTPSVTNATTTVNTQTGSGLVISRNAADGAEVTNFKITGITNGTLFKNNGTTQINNGDFITIAEGTAGLKFTPASNLSSPVTTFNFQAQSSTSNSDAGLGGGTATATITVNCGPTMVTNSIDGGAGSLRDIINGACPGSTITFAPGLVSPITLTTGELVINKNLAINGPGVNTLTISGNNTSRVFNIQAGSIVTITDLTIANGKVTGANNGGGLLNDGTLTLTNCNVYGNSAPNNGGGIFNNGSLTLNNCNIGGTGAGQPNTALVESIFNNSGTLLMTGGSIVGNSGRGISTVGGLVSLNSVAITNNSTDGAGGGIFIGNGTASITNCLFANNTALNVGGAILISASATPVTVVNSTFSGNSGSLGGAINAQGGTITLTNVTLTNNRATNAGGGINRSGGTVTLRNTIVAGNFQGASPSTTADNINGTVDATSSFNLIGSGSFSGGLTNGVNNNQVGVSNALLGPLANNGGLTQTHALLAGSPALDAGNNSLVVSPPFSGPPFTDQRGASFARIVDGPDADTTDTVDVGAFEAQVSVEDITDKTTNEDTQLQFTFNVGGAASITTVTATSGNTSLVPNNPANIALSGSGSTRTLTINPAANQFGSSTITVTVNGANSQSMTDTFVLTVNAVADTPSVTNATTTVNIQTASGLVITSNPADGTEVTNFKITNIQNGTLFKNNGSTQINSGDFITVAEGNAGLKFTPTSNLSSPVTTFSFQAQASTSSSNAGLGGGTATATITVNCGLTVVTNSNDSGAGSLRAIINSACPGSTITFDMTPGHVTSPITLTTGELVIDKNLTISGPGANILTISGISSSNSRVFRIPSGNTVTMTDLTIANGQMSGSGNNGGGVLNNGTLTLNNCNLFGNATINNRGGGIYNDGTSLTLNNCNIGGTLAGQPNNAPAGGGGIYNNSGTLLMTGGSVVGNSNGGIVIADGTTTLNGVAISNNSMNTGGGGIAALGGTTSISNCLIVNNLGNNSGGGISTNGSAAVVTVVNSTISGNITANIGGGVSSQSGSTTLTNVTITNNRSENSTGGGIFASASSPTILRNTIVAGNFGGPSPGTTANNIGGTLNSSSSFNLIGTGGAGGLTNGVNNNQVGVSSALLGPLANNGGPTPTHALLAGSPALDAGNNSLVVNPPFSGPPFTDQRGASFARIVDGPDADTTDTVDIGAFEAQVSVEDITDKTTNEDTQLQFTFNVGGAASITTVTATSGNTSLVPNNPANVALSGSGSTRTLTINPAANQFGTSTITVTVNGPNGQSMTDTFVLTVNAVAETPSVTNATTNEDTQTTSGLVISRNAADGAEVTHFKISSITNGTLFKSDGTTPISNNSFITVAEGNAGLKFTPAANLFSPSNTFSFQVQGATSAAGAGLSSGFATATITVNPAADTPSVTNATTSVNTQTTSGLVISRNPADGAEVTNFKITNILNGTLFKNNGTTQINNNDFITFAEGNLGLKFTPANNLSSPGTAFSFQVQASTSSSNAGLGGSTATATITVNGSLVRFSSTTYDTTESSSAATITVERVGDLTSTVTVDYASPDDSAATPPILPCPTVGLVSSRCDFTTAVGSLRFAPGETTKTFNLLISQDNYVEGSESLPLTLSNVSPNAMLGSPSTATLTIADDGFEPAANPIDDASNFVRQHYHDFLNREPDAAGLAFWTNEITSCGSNKTCIDAKRINVSVAFFLSVEFQNTGYLVERLYKASYGDATGTSTIGGIHQLPVPIVKFGELLPDTQTIGQGLVVGDAGWEAVLENNKQAFVTQFVQRARFTTAYANTLTPTQFVNMLFANAGVAPTASERQAAIDEFGGAGTSADVAARGRALRRVAENGTLIQQEFNRALVLMQYYGYLRRNPDAAPDSDHSGYDFWLTKLNQFTQPGDNVLVRVQKAEMVKAFLVAAEYRRRFGALFDFSGLEK